MLVEPAKPNDPKGMCRAINRLSGGKIEQKASELDSIVVSGVAVISDAVSAVSNLAQANSLACSSLQTDVLTISNQVSDLIADVATNVIEIDAVSDMQSSLITDVGLISDTLSAVSDLAGANSNAISVVEDLADANSAACSSLQTDIATISDALSAVSDLAEANSNAASLISNLAQANSDAISTVSNLAEANSDALSLVSNLAQANSNAASLISNLAQANSDAISAVSDLAAANSVACSSLQTDVLANSNAISTTSNLAQANSLACSSLQTDILTISNQVSDLIADVASESATQSSLITDIVIISDTLSTVSDLAANNSAMVSSHVTDIQTISDQVSDLIADVATISNTLSAVSDLAEANSVAINSVQSTLSSVIVSTAKVLSDATSIVQSGLDSVEILASDAYSLASNAKSIASTHKANNGADHSFIDQDVKVAAKPIFAGLTISGAVDILHTAIEADDHALELDVNAAAFGDVKALEIAYTTDSIAQGQDEGVILINVDEILAKGGDVFGLEVLATEGSAAIVGMKVGAGVGAVHQDAGTFIDPTTGMDNASDVAVMIDGSIATTTSIFEALNEYIIIGAVAVFEEIEFILTTPTSNPGIKPTFWYSSAAGGGFTQFTPTDGTDGFRHTGVVAWDASDLVGHIVGGVTGTFDIKIMRTKTGSLSPSPVLGYARTAATTEYVWDENGDANLNNLALGSDLAVTEGGTGASTAANARTNLGVTSAVTSTAKVLSDATSEAKASAHSELLSQVKTASDATSVVKVSAASELASAISNLQSSLSNTISEIKVSAASELASTAKVLSDATSDAYSLATAGGGGGITESHLNSTALSLATMTDSAISDVVAQAVTDTASLATAIATISDTLSAVSDLVAGNVTEIDAVSDSLSGAVSDILSLEVLASDAYSLATVAPVGASTHTVNLLQADNTAAKQVKIDAVAKYIPCGSTVTFQFEIGSTHTETATLNFLGFYGGGNINVLGNIAEANATILHLTQDTFLDFTTNPCVGLYFYGCYVFITVRNLKIQIQDVAGSICIQSWICANSFSVYNCYLLGSGVTTGTYGFYATACLISYCDQTYFEDVYYGIRSRMGTLFSYINADNPAGTMPKYGLYAEGAGVIGKSGEQPDGSIADERIANGGVIR